MRAVTVVPLQQGSVDLTELPEPPEADGPVLVRTRAVGVCGTDLEIIGGEYGWAPPGEDRLAIGHESLGEVMEAPDGSGFAPGDLVVAIVRRPDPAPCANCAVGEWDMCRNGQYTEWGIKEHHGYARERYRITPDFLVKVDPGLGNLGVLLEPTTVVAKAWDHIERIGGRAVWQPKTVLVTGAGPIGLLAALLGVQRGMDVHVLDQVTDGLKPELVAALGATYHHGAVADIGVEPDVAIECTGVAPLIFDVMDHAGANGIVCLTGVSSGGRDLSVDVGLLNRRLVLENDVVFGSVNANRRHYEAGAKALAKADKQWLGRLITRSVPLDDWKNAYTRQPTDVKVVLSFDSDTAA
ncbi:MAG TPA: glucose 1-dehydrogenase [Acidimicrobiales bacterium]|jgi:threonine dehydrogenase-like Zn-dependent dehydrogenase|nr:glucose 1-dehydrogenase [Acidimicrobiales bacterium]